MVFCSSCGKKAEDGVRFCSGCGKALDSVSNDNVSSQSGANLTEETKGNLKMPKSTARIISKLGLSMVAIGFFMPFTQKMNAFGILDNLSSVASWLGIDMGFYKFLIYLIFISSVIGVISLCLLFANKSIRLAFDWCTVLIANGSFLILLIRLLDLANEAMGAFGGRSSDLGSLIGDNLQIGAYFIFIGLIISVVFLIVATVSIKPECGMAIVAYLIFFIPLLTGYHKKSEFVKFHTNQGTVLFLFSILYNFASGILPLSIAMVFQLPELVLLVLGIVHAVKGEIKPLPLIGKIRIIK